MHRNFIYHIFVVFLLTGLLVASCSSATNQPIMTAPSQGMGTPTASTSVLVPTKTAIRQSTQKTKTQTPALTETRTPIPRLTQTPSLTPTAKFPEPAPIDVRIREADGMEMVYVSDGIFTMGSNSGYIEEQPVHEVYLDAYWIDKFEVTNTQYTACVAVGTCIKPAYEKSNTHNSYYSNADYAKFPVINVDWYQAQRYCEWAGGRLPTEAEWEKAARGTDGRTYPWGNTSPNSSMANYNWNVGDTKAVGSYPAGISPYGALDMAGNVWEWVSDWYDANYYSSGLAENPIGSDNGSYKLLRGGAWYSDPGTVGASYRTWVLPDNFMYDLGFRCVSSP